MKEENKKTEYIKYLEYSDIVRVGKALSSEVRIEILGLLGENSLNVGQIAECLGISQSNATQNISILEQAGLIHTRRENGPNRGKQKICSLVGRSLVLPLLHTQELGTQPFIKEAMPIGLYTDIQITGPCGLVSENEIIGRFDEPGSFMRAQRSQAQLLWFTSGWIEYKFPLTLEPYQQRQDIKSIEFRAELCSEYPGSKLDWPSDITLWINGKELGTWLSPGDMGERRGVLTPPWWRDHSTQHGFLTTWSIDSSGVSINGGPSKLPLNIGHLGLESCREILVRIGIKKNASHQGGLNLFGRKFGDYAQDLLLKIGF